MQYRPKLVDVDVDEDDDVVVVIEWISDTMVIMVIIDGKNSDLFVSQVQIRFGTYITILGFF